MQDQSDIDFLNNKYYYKGKQILWELGITIITPLNKN